MKLHLPLMQEEPMADNNNNGTDEKQQVQEHLHLLLYEQIDALKADLARTRENARRWHRNAQQIAKLEAENKWLRERFYKEQSEHELSRRYARSNAAARIAHLRSQVRKQADLIVSNLSDPSVQDQEIILPVEKEYMYMPGDVRKYTQHVHVTHPDDHPAHEKQLMFEPKNHKAGFETLIKRLIRERDQAILKLNNLLKTL